MFEGKCFTSKETTFWVLPESGEVFYYDEERGERSEGLPSGFQLTRKTMEEIAKYLNHNTSLPLFEVFYEGDEITVFLYGYGMVVGKLINDEDIKLCYYTPPRKAFLWLVALSLREGGEAK